MAVDALRGPAERRSASFGVLGALTALADPTRFQLVLALRESERCVRDLEDATGLSQSLISHHLAVLTEAGLVTSYRQGRFNLFAIDPVASVRLLDGLARVLDPVHAPDASLPGGNPTCCR